MGESSISIKNSIWFIFNVIADGLFIVTVQAVLDQQILIYWTHSQVIGQFKKNIVKEWQHCCYSCWADLAWPSAGMKNSPKSMCSHVISVIYFRCWWWGFQSISLGYSIILIHNLPLKEFRTKRSPIFYLVAVHK